MNHPDHPGRNSFAWQYFGDLVSDLDDLKVDPSRIYCQICLKISSITNNLINLRNWHKKRSFSHTCATTSIKTHLSHVHAIYEKSTNDENDRVISNILSPHPERHNQQYFTQKLALTLTKSGAPFNLVENESFRDFFQEFLPNYDLPHRNALTASLENMHQHVEQKIVNFFQQEESVIAGSVTLDIYHHKLQKEHYLGINIHFIFNATLNTLVLKLIPLKGFQGSQEIASLVENVLKEFNINRLIINFVTDRGANLIKTVDDVLQLERIDCIAHSLDNLFSKDLMGNDMDFKRVYDIGNQIYHAFLNHKDKLDPNNFYNIVEPDEEESIPDMIDLRMQNLNDLDEQLNDLSSLNPQVTLKKYSMTRFFGSGLMLESIVKNEPNLAAALIAIDKPGLYPVKKDWDLLKSYSVLVNQVREFSQSLSASKTPTMHLVVLIRSEIQDLIENFEFNDSVREKLLEDFERRFPIEPIHIAAALLHPSLVDLKQIDSYLEARGTNRIQFMLDYADQFNLNSNKSPESEPVHHNSTLHNLVLKHSNKEKNVKLTQKSKFEDELIRYFRRCSEGTTSLPIEDCPIEFWSSIEQKTSYPTLAKLSLIVLCTLASQNGQERSFRRVKLISSGLRSRMSSERINEALFVFENTKFLKKHNLTTNQVVIDEKPKRRAPETNEQDERSKKRQIDPQMKDNKRRKTKSNVAAKTEESINERIKIEQDRRLKRTEEFNANKTKYQLKRSVLDEMSKVKKEDIDSISDEAANDSFDMRARSNKDARIGEEDCCIISNGTLIDDLQIFVSIKKLIHQTDKSDEYSILYNMSTIECPSSESNLLFINYLNQSYSPMLKIIFLPIFYRPNHWALVVVDLKDNRSLIFDSLLKSTNDKQYITASKKVYKLIQLVNLIDESRQMDIANHQFCLVQDSPQQPNDSLDCGVYTVLFARYVMDADFEIFEKHSNFKRFYLNRIIENVQIPTDPESPRKSKSFKLNSDRYSLKWKRTISIQPVTFFPALSKSKHPN